MTKVWQTGDIITAEDMNRLENKGGGCLIINRIEETDRIRLNKTYAEIKNSLISGTPAFLIYSEENSWTYSCNMINGIQDGNSENIYTVFSDDGAYYAEAENDYPSRDTSNPK